MAETCRRAHLSVQVEAGCNLTPDHSHSRPADVLISNWVLGKTAACDISVTSPLNSNIMSEAGVTAGAAAQATELRKHEANDVKCSELGWLCIPLVVESYGAWGKEAMESFSSLASRLAITSSRPKSAVLSELYGRLNLNLVRANGGPTYDCRWPANLNGAMDYQVLKGNIVAYKIQWSNGAWTDWFVPGYNDVDYKFNPAAMSCSVPYEANSMRRMWSYFYDHTHLYILCQ
ncbi:hypothetical protein EMCRGX_G023389 [Ephydatia muelleri]